MDNQDPYYYVVRLNDVQINQKSVSMVVESFHSNSSWNQFVPWSIREPPWPCFQRRYLINSNNCLWNNTPLFLLSLSHPTFWMVLMYWQVDPHRTGQNFNSILMESLYRFHLLCTLYPIFKMAKKRGCLEFNRLLDMYSFLFLFPIVRHSRRHIYDGITHYP